MSLLFAPSIVVVIQLVEFLFYLQNMTTQIHHFPVYDAKINPGRPLFKGCVGIQGVSVVVREGSFLNLPLNVIDIAQDSDLISSESHKMFVSALQL